MTRLTRQHFQVIAHHLYRTRPAPATGEHQQWHMDVRTMADVCGDFNPAFNRYRFMVACGATEPDPGDDPDAPD